jgi:hypothetical protein
MISREGKIKICIQRNIVYSGETCITPLIFMCADMPLGCMPVGLGQLDTRKEDIAQLPFLQVRGAEVESSRVYPEYFWRWD